MKDFLAGGWVWRQSSVDRRACRQSSDDGAHRTMRSRPMAKELVEREMNRQHGRFFPFILFLGLETGVNEDLFHVDASLATHSLTTLPSGPERDNDEGNGACGKWQRGSHLRDIGRDYIWPTTLSFSFGLARWFSLFL